MSEMSYEELLEFTSYDPETGRFFWKKKSGYKSVVGKEIGSRKGNGYVEASINRKRVHLHRMAWLYMTGKMPEGQIDHVNGDRSDNRFSNLREATNGQNQQNAKLKVTNKSGYKGVYWSNSNRKWVACICVDGKSKYVGAYATPKEAHMAWLEAAKYRGEFMRAS